MCLIITSTDVVRNEGDCEGLEKVDRSITEVTGRSSLGEIKLFCKSTLITLNQAGHRLLNRG
jgi:hypothetical protein